MSWPVFQWLYIQFSLEIVCYLICTYFDGFVMCWMCTKIKMNLCEICLVLGVCECAAVGNSSSVLHFSCWCNNIIPWLKIEWLCPRLQAFRSLILSLSLSLFFDRYDSYDSRICFMFYATIKYGVNWIFDSVRFCALGIYANWYVRVIGRNILMSMYDEMVLHVVPMQVLYFQISDTLHAL